MNVFTCQNCYVTRRIIMMPYPVDLDIRQSHTCDPFSSYTVPKSEAKPNSTRTLEIDVINFYHRNHRKIVSRKKIPTDNQKMTGEFKLALKTYYIITFCVPSVARSKAALSVLNLHISCILFFKHFICIKKNSYILKYLNCFFIIQNTVKYYIFCMLCKNFLLSRYFYYEIYL